MRLETPFLAVDHPVVAAQLRLGCVKTFWSKPPFRLGHRETRHELRGSSSGCGKKTRLLTGVPPCARSTALARIRRLPQNVGANRDVPRKARFISASLICPYPCPPAPARMARPFALAAPRPASAVTNLFRSDANGYDGPSRRRCSTFLAHDLRISPFEVLLDSGAVSKIPTHNWFLQLSCLSGSRADH